MGGLLLLCDMRMLPLSLMEVWVALTSGWMVPCHWRKHETTWLGCSVLTALHAVDCSFAKKWHYVRDVLSKIYNCGRRVVYLSLGCMGQ